MEQACDAVRRQAAEFEMLLAQCRGRQVWLQTHNFPDPDAIASAFGLQRLLADLGVTAQICCVGQIDKLSTAKLVDTFGIRLAGEAELTGRMHPEDLIICVDSQKSGGNIRDLPGRELGCIDHHPTVVPVSYAYRDVRLTGACATLVAEYYIALGRTPDRDVATALLYGIKMDTLQFSRGVTEQDIRMFSYLFPLCDRTILAGLERNNMELEDLKAYGAAISGIRLYGSTGISGIPFACPDALIAILSDFLLSLAEVQLTVVYSRRSDGIKFSVRSEDPKLHAGELVRRALEGVGSGGGHSFMAGGLIPAERIGALGSAPEDAIVERFLHALQNG